MVTPAHPSEQSLVFAAEARDEKTHLLAAKLGVFTSARKNRDSLPFTIFRQTMNCSAALWCSLKEASIYNFIRILRLFNLPQERQVVKGFLLEFCPCEERMASPGLWLQWKITAKNSGFTAGVEVRKVEFSPGDRLTPGWRPSLKEIVDQIHHVAEVNLAVAVDISDP